MSKQDTELDYGRRIIRLGGRGRTLLMVDARALVLTAVLVIAAVALALFGLVSGSAGITIAEAVRALLGQGDAFTTMVVVEWRAPRVLIAAILGATLAMSGAIFQNLTGNPLGSPDVIGFQTGSYTGALIVMLLLQGGSLGVTVGALIGGIGTAAVVFLFASKRGSAGGIRLIVVGIAVSAILGSVNVWLLLTASEENAIMAGLWGAGNLSGTSWASLLRVAIGSAVFVVGAVLLARPMRLLQIGVPFATALGQNVRRVQAAAIVVGVGLIAMATATVGPISFIALAAPQIARRLARSDGLALGPTAAVGCVLLLLADAVAQRVDPESPLPVGIVTVAIGGAYFLWLIIRQGRQK